MRGPTISMIAASDLEHTPPVTHIEQRGVSRDALAPRSGKITECTGKARPVAEEASYPLLAETIEEKVGKRATGLALEGRHCRHAVGTMKWEGCMPGKRKDVLI